MSIGVRKGLGTATYVVVTVFAASPTSSDAPRSAQALGHAASPSAGVAGDLTVKFSQPPGTDGEAAPSGIDWVDRLPNGALADDFIGDGRPITAVRWWGSSLGAVELTEPRNTCSLAPTVAEGTYAFSTVGATTDGPIEPGLCDFFGDSQVASDVWSCYRASCSGVAAASLCGSAFDTKMAVYEGCACPTGPSAIRCNDDACSGDFQSEASFPVTEGGEYLIRIGGFGGDQGEGTLTITCVESNPCTVRNGGFESGDATGWVATTNARPEFFPWTIGPAGTGTDFHTSSPLAGGFDVMNGFDGDAGLRYELYQEVTLPPGVTISLSTNHRIQYDSLGIPSSQPRELDITLRDTNNNVLAALYHQDVFLDGAPNTDLGWNTQVFDVTSFGGQAVRVHFEEFIPEDGTGPALIEFDEISLTCSAPGTDGPTMTGIHGHHDPVHLISRAWARGELGASLDDLRARYKAVGANGPSRDPEPTAGPRRATRVRPSVRGTGRHLVTRAAAQAGTAALPKALMARTSWEDMVAFHRETSAAAEATIRTEQLLAPPLVASFPGTMDDQTVVPPDTNGAVGPSHVVELLNNGIRVFTRTGVPLTELIDLQSFWSALGTGIGQPASDPFDPKILYDQYTGRWIATADSPPANGDGSFISWILTAVSTTGNPTGSWILYANQSSVTDGTANHSSHFSDFPGLGVDPNNVVITNNMFTMSAFCTDIGFACFSDFDCGPAGSCEHEFVHADVWVIDKAPLLAGTGPLERDVHYALFHDPGNTFDFSGATFQPTHTFGQTPGTAVSYLVDEGWNDIEGSALRMIRLQEFTGTGAGAALNTTGWFEVAGYNFNQLEAPQAGCSFPVSTNDTHLLNAVARNGRVWTTHSVGAGVDPDTAAATGTEVAWYEFDPASAAPFPGGKPTQQGRVSDPSLFYYFPSIAVNRDQCVALGFSGSDANTFVSAYYTLHDPSLNPPGRTQPVSLLKAGEGPYLKTFGGDENRWGDFSATVVDPLDDATFWTLQEYARVPVFGPEICSSDAGLWGTWWGAFRCVRPPRGRGPDGWLISFHEALGIGTGPLQALGVYFCDADVVRVHEASVPTCGEHPVDEHVVDLAECCLVHSEPDSRNDRAPAAPSGFFDEPCLIYGINIQGVVGREFIDGGAGVCVETVTQRQAPGDFWGWHATNNGRAHSIGLQAALLSSATMLDSDWLYGPWEALNVTCATPNMSFELLTSEPRGYADCNSNMAPDTCDTIEVGDFDSDGTVGLGDHAGHAICLAGPGAPPDALGSGCLDACRAAFDVDGDGDVDLRDTAHFLASLGID